MHFQICGNNDGHIIHVFKNCISIPVATVLEVSKMTVPICTSHWCLVMSFWHKVCIYSHTRGVKLGLGLGFMQTSQVLPHWLKKSFSFWTLPYTQRHCHVRIEKGPVQTVAIILEAHNFLEYHYPPVSQTRLKPSPRLKCKSELFQLKETCIDRSLNISVPFCLKMDTSNVFNKACFTRDNYSNVLIELWPNPGLV